MADMTSGWKGGGLFHIGWDLQGVHVCSLPLAAMRACPSRRALLHTRSQPQAGEDVTVYYNPNNSVLPGREKIFIKCGRGLHCAPTCACVSVAAVEDCRACVVCTKPCSL